MPAARAAASAARGIVGAARPDAPAKRPRGQVPSTPAPRRRAAGTPNRRPLGREAARPGGHTTSAKAAGRPPPTRAQGCAKSAEPPESHGGDQLRANGAPLSARLCGGPTAEWSRSRRAGAPGTVNSAAFLPCPPRQPGRLGATRPTDSLTPGRAPPSLARHTPLTRNPASLFPRPSPPRPLKSAKGTGSPAVDPEEIRSCIPPRDFARSSGRVVATGRPGRATLLQRRRTATSVSASSPTSCL